MEADDRTPYVERALRVVAVVAVVAAAWPRTSTMPFISLAGACALVPFVALDLLNVLSGVRSRPLLQVLFAFGCVMALVAGDWRVGTACYALRQTLRAWNPVSGVAMGVVWSAVTLSLAYLVKESIESEYYRRGHPGATITSAPLRTLLSVTTVRWIGVKLWASLLMLAFNAMFLRARTPNYPALALYTRVLFIGLVGVAVPSTFVGVFPPVPASMGFGSGQAPYAVLLAVGVVTALVPRETERLAGVVARKWWMLILATAVAAAAAFGITKEPWARYLVIASLITPVIAAYLSHMFGEAFSDAVYVVDFGQMRNRAAIGLGVGVALLATPLVLPRDADELANLVVVSVTLQGCLLAAAFLTLIALQWYRRAALRRIRAHLD